MKTPLARWLPATLWFAVIAVMIFFAGTNRLQWFFTWIERHPGTDKIGHFLLIGGMAGLLELALRGRVYGCLGVKWPIASTVVAIVFTAEEFTQLGNSFRHFDWSDLAANLAGIIFFGWLARRHLARRRT